MPASSARIQPGELTRTGLGFDLLQKVGQLGSEVFSPAKLLPSKQEGTRELRRVPGISHCWQIGQTVDLVDTPSCGGYPVPGDTQGEAGWGSEQPVSIPIHGRGLAGL